MTAFLESKGTGGEEVMQDERIRMVVHGEMIHLPHGLKCADEFDWHDIPVRPTNQIAVVGIGNGSFFMFERVKPKVN